MKSRDADSNGCIPPIVEGRSGQSWSSTGARRPWATNREGEKVLQIRQGEPVLAAGLWGLRVQIGDNPGTGHRLGRPFLGLPGRARRAPAAMSAAGTGYLASFDACSTRPGQWPTGLKKLFGG